MDWKLFWITYATSVVAVLVQWPFAYCDGSGFLLRRQLDAAGVKNGYSLLEHAGMWGDILFLSPLLALIVGQHGNFDWKDGVVFAVGIVGSVYTLIFWKGAFPDHPEAYAHDGMAPMAGKLHSVYMMLSAPIIIHFLILIPARQIAWWEIGVAAGLLVVHFLYMAPQKFSPDWYWDKYAKAYEFFAAIVLTVTLCQLALRRLLSEL